VAKDSSGNPSPLRGSVAPLSIVHALAGLLLKSPLGTSVDRARSRGLLARVKIQLKIVLVGERGLEARGYVLHFCIGSLGNSPWRGYSLTALRASGDWPFFKNPLNKSFGF
jgi:hypothetical protein